MYFKKSDLELCEKVADYLAKDKNCPEKLCIDFETFVLEQRKENRRITQICYEIISEKRKIDKNYARPKKK